MTITTIEKQNILTTVLSIIKRKNDHKKEWEAIAKLELFYASDIKDIQNRLHKVNWEYITIDSMTDDHLYNTIKQALVSNRGNWERINKKYIDEAKMRPTLMERILTIDNSEIVPYQGYDINDDDDMFGL